MREAFGLIIQEYSDAGDFVSNIGRNLGEVLDGDDEQEPPQTRDEQKKKEKVTKELSLSLKITRFQDYQDIEDSNQVLCLHHQSCKK